MIVSISYEKGTNPVLVAACEMAIDRRMPVSMVMGNLRISAVEFRDFLSCIWHGFAEASKGSHGRAMRRRYECVVVMPNEARYNVWFQLNEDLKGITYGSIDFRK
jgi:hypothetical protein